MSAELVNQEPYPAFPGEYVEILLQLNGINNDCSQGVAVDLVLDYPFSFDSSEENYRFLESNTYVGQSEESWNNLYKIRVDEDALEGDYEVEFRFKENVNYFWDDFLFEKFNIKVEDSRTNFEVHISNYNIEERDLVFQILNIGDKDIEALTLEIPVQNNIVVKSSNRNIVGDLDSNEYTFANFEAIPFDGEITVLIHYTDAVNERRTIEKNVFYNSNYFVDSLENIQPDKTNTYVIFGVISAILVLFIFRKFLFKKKNRTKKFSI